MPTPGGSGEAEWCAPNQPGVFWSTCGVNACKGSAFHVAAFKTSPPLRLRLPPEGEAGGGRMCEMGHRRGTQRRPHARRLSDETPARSIEKGALSRCIAMFIEALALSPCNSSMCFGDAGVYDEQKGGFHDGRW